MKRLMIILAILVPAILSGQTLYVDSVSTSAANIVAADTIIPFNVVQVGTSTAIEVEFTSMNANNSTIEIMVALREGNWMPLAISGWPFTLNVTTYTDTLTHKAVVSYKTDNLPFPHKGIRYKKGSVSAGYLRQAMTVIVPDRRATPFK